ncbi:hypothetical protein ACFQYP_06770 [Nonomuraea antimicrobica]
MVTDKPPSGSSPLDAMLTPDDRTAAQADATRWRYGFLVVVAGIAAVLVAFGAAVFATRSSRRCSPGWRGW